jgi:hypothetical protein
MLQIVNRGATLQPSDLDLGRSSKASDNTQAGAHGEGLKVALLVLMRGVQNHCVRCCSGQFNWHFNFTTSGRLVARLVRMSAQAIAKDKRQAQEETDNGLIPFVPKPGRDVQFFIGEQKQGREKGIRVSRRPVKLEDFKAWTKAALFLQNTNANPEGIISTMMGDLLLDPSFRGNIYLKGLLLLESTAMRSASITNLPLMYGYNFASGSTNRERQSVASAAEEAKAIHVIWGKALVAKPLLISNLFTMLNTSDPQYADVFQAKYHLGTDMADKLKKYLLGDECAGTWYSAANINWT